MKKGITTDELLRIEADYNEKQKTIPMIFTEEQGLVPANYNDDFFFFNQKYIAKQARNLTNELKHELSKWQLTKFEMLMLLCYQGDLSEVFDKEDPKLSSFPINEMCKGLDTVLIKAPSCIEVSVVYRQHKSNNVLDFKKEKRGLSSPI